MTPAVITAVGSTEAAMARAHRLPLDREYEILGMSKQAGHNRMIAPGRRTIPPTATSNTASFVAD
jgi:hypothetical protein